MNNIIIKSPWIMGNLSLKPGKIVQISVVAYEHALGMPARFCAGLIPAIGVATELKKNGFEIVVRVIDPTPIANHCNGWQPKQSQFREVTADFFNSHNVSFFFDIAEPLNEGALVVLSELAADLESTADMKVADIVQRIKVSGKKHGGNTGANNASLYMAAHPFSWLDMYHPLIWKKAYPVEEYQFVNLMSLPEERFTVVRRFLQEQRPDLCTNHNPVDRFTKVCNTPCYIPLRGEPMYADLVSKGYDWCFARYSELKGRSGNNVRIYEDFKALMSFVYPSKV